MDLHLYTCFFFIFVIADVNAGQCHHTLQRLTFTMSEHNEKLTLRLLQPIMVERLKIRLCDHERTLAHEKFNVTFLDASDLTHQERIYSQELIGEFADASNFIVLFEPAMYTRTVHINKWHALKCSTLHVLGCTPYDMFNQSFCQNGGKIVIIAHARPDLWEQLANVL
ncbi:uncharacterized protein LOC132724484, partial [Ruditapes philippinarum]|uniref:uncharacterized protein LOC132724484 n=1 Tax=Ruditapes philippinarum TaxID=129788 RepID=UPI00295ACD50